QLSYSVARPLWPQTLHVHAGAFEQQENLVSQFFGFAKARLAAQPGQTLALVTLKFFDHLTRRMILLRNLHSSIGKRTAAVCRVSKTLAQMFRPPLQLRACITGPRLRGLAPRCVGFRR